jgi:HAD superfamily hydrolase (TIGR01509 family)
MQPNAEIVRPAAILFDLDGTLVDTVPTRIAAWSRALEAAGLPFDRNQLGMLIGSDGKHLVAQVARAAGMAVDETRAEEIDRRSGEIYDALNRQPQTLPGVRELLASVERAGIPWAIATSSRAAQVGASVAALGLAEPPTVVDGSSVTRAKPAPDLLLHAADVLGVDPTACWLVGDSTWDMLAGIAAGMTAIAITAGSAVDEEALRGAGARLVVASATDLLELVGRDPQPGGRGSV